MCSPYLTFLQGEKGVEISLTIKLPTANINLPRDLSKQELSVLKSIRLNESHEPKNVNEIEPMLDKTEAKFPELLISRSYKTAKGKLVKDESVELSDIELVNV
jgi:hypothetical protein